MYKIEMKDEHLLVKFEDNFDFPLIKLIIRHVTMMREYPSTNDIWLIGKHRADIRLGELETMVHELHCRCPRDATRTKTAIVAEQGLTQAILELWVNALRKKVSFEISIFNTLEEAQIWMGEESPVMA